MAAMVIHPLLLMDTFLDHSGQGPWFYWFPRNIFDLHTTSLHSVCYAWKPNEPTNEEFVWRHLFMDGQGTERSLGFIMNADDICRKMIQPSKSAWGLGLVDLVSNCDCDMQPIIVICHSFCSVVCFTSFKIFIFGCSRFGLEYSEPFWTGTKMHALRAVI